MWVILHIRLSQSPLTVGAGVMPTTRKLATRQGATRVEKERLSWLLDMEDERWSVQASS